LRSSQSPVRFELLVDQYENTREPSAAARRMTVWRSWQKSFPNEQKVRLPFADNPVDRLLQKRAIT